MKTYWERLITTPIWVSLLILGCLLTRTADTQQPRLGLATMVAIARLVYIKGQVDQDQQHAQILKQDPHVS